MKNFALTNRLRAIEGTRGTATFKLLFADGSSRAVQVAHDFRLKVFIDACSKLHCYPPKAPEGIVLPPAEPEPTTSSDALIDLMAGAVGVEGSRWFNTIFHLCKDLGEARKEARRANSQISAD
jgi:hypothetical protein